MKYSFFKKIKINFKPIFQTWIKLCGGFFSLCTIVFIFISWDDIKINRLWIKIVILIGFLIILFVISTIIITLFKTEKIWSNGIHKLLACYGNIIEISKIKGKKIIVIPVNDTLETIVDDSADIINPLVSKNTIHGKWILFLKNNNITKEQIDEKIERFLSKYNIQGEKINRERGKNISYPIGTVVQVVFKELPETTFYLLVISKFDENNKAFSDFNAIKGSINSLLKYYDNNGQGDPLYLPLIGTGRSRTEMNHQESYQLLKSMILTNEKQINGTITIVIYDRDRDKISIFK